MPAPRTTDELLELVRKSGVVEEKRLAAGLDALRSNGPLPGEPGKIASLLVRDAVLTHFQAEQILQGKWRKFTIGKYKVLERLGAGGMGSVFLCEHILMRRRVAVKVLPGTKAQDSSSLERFHREARAVAALDHPNIVRAYDIDQEDNLHFLVMEHVDGPNLQEIIKRTGPMDPVRAAHYVRQAALGLQHAHEQGLVHRDIKPGNILVDRNGIVKVLDMGLARFFNDEDDMLTKKYDENVLGTADYLAPEQALDSHGVDIRADIYSLGGTFYFCLTGRTPFAEGTVAQKLIWHQTRQPKPVQSQRAEVPDGIAAIVDKMMAKSPEGRYQTPMELADALTPFTQTPIPPPPEQEMPQLSPAALRAPSGASPPSSEAGGPGTKDDVTPTRKIWSVAGGPGGAAAKAAAPRVTPAAMPTPVSTPATAAPRASSATRPAVAKVPRTEVKNPAPAAGGNGVPPTPRPVNGPNRPPTEIHPPPPALPAEPEPKGELPFEEVSESLAERRRRHLPQRSTGFWVVVGLGALAFVAGVAALVYFLMGGPKKGPREPLRLTSSDPHALVALCDRARPGDRIILNTDTIRGSGIYLQNLPPNLTIEPEEGKKVVWSFAPNARNHKFLLLLQGPDLTLRGITFDGEGKAATGVQLYSDCPGTRLERVTIRGFTQQGIAVTSCQGSEGRPVVLDDLTIETAAPTQSAIRFSLSSGAKHVLNNRYLSLTNFKSIGPGKEVTATDKKDLGPGVALPKTVQVQYVP